MSPPPLSWGRVLVLALVLMIGMLWLAWVEGSAEVCSSSESLLLELSSLLEDEELLESEELSPLLSWSMTRASAINSVHSSIYTNKDKELCDNYPHFIGKECTLNKTKKPSTKMRHESWKSRVEETAPHVTSLDVVQWGRRGCLLFGRGTLGAGRGLAAAAATTAAVVTLHLLAQATGLLLQARMDLTAALSPGNAHVQYKQRHVECFC